MRETLRNLLWLGERGEVDRDFGLRLFDAILEAMVRRARCV
jgi:hypothetical protein